VSVQEACHSDSMHLAHAPPSRIEKTSGPGSESLGRFLPRIRLTYHRLSVKWIATFQQAETCTHSCSSTPSEKPDLSSRPAAGRVPCPDSSLVQTAGAN
jgi:hypothetical protein